MIDLIIEVPTAERAFAMVAPFADRIESIEPINDLPNGLAEWRIVVKNPDGFDGRAAISGVMQRTQSFGFGAYAYEQPTEAEEQQRHEEWMVWFDSICYNGDKSNDNGDNK